MFFDEDLSFWGVEGDHGIFVLTIWASAGIIVIIIQCEDAK